MFVYNYKGFPSILIGYVRGCLRIHADSFKPGSLYCHRSPTSILCEWAQIKTYDLLVSIGYILYIVIPKKKSNNIVSFID